MAVCSQAPPAVGQLLLSARTADLSEDGETLDSDDDDLPSVKQILPSSKRAKRVIDLTGDDDDGEGGHGDFTEVSWLTRHLTQRPKFGRDARSGARNCTQITHQ